MQYSIVNQIQAFKKSKTLQKIIYDNVKKYLMRPKPYRLNHKQEAWASLGKRSTLYLPKLNLKVQTWEFGEGPVILLMHGWAGRGIQLYHLIPSLMDKGFKVVTFDAPGHGQSQGQGATYLEFVTSLLEVAHHYKEIHGVIAHSMGVGAALNLANELSKSDLKMVLIAGHFDMKNEFYKWAKKSRIPKVFLDAFMGLSMDMYGISFDEINPKNLAPKIKGEVLLIHDKHDRAAQFKSSELLKENIQHSHLIATEGLGHNKILADKMIIESISQFIESGLANQKAKGE